MTVKFLSFNNEINPTNDPIYIPYWNRRPIGRVVGLPASTIGPMVLNDPLLEIAMVIPEDIIVLEFTNSAQIEMIIKIIEDLKERIMVVKTGSAIEIYARASGLPTVKTIVALGASGSFKTFAKKSTVITPFKHPTLSKSPYLTDVEIIYYNGIGDLPFWLYPLVKTKRSQVHFPFDDSHAIQIMLDHIKELRRNDFAEVDIEDIMNIVNTYICTTPLMPTVITKILNSKSEEVSEEDFFKDKMFLHNKMAEYIMKKCHIKKGSKASKLYHYNNNDGIYETNEDYLKSIMTRTVPILRDSQKNEVLKYLEAYLETERVVFNKGEYTIVFKNCILDLITMTTSPLGPDNLETIQLNVNYNPDAKSVTVDEFFSTASCNDRDVEQLLFETIGYSFLKTVSLEKSFILTGEGRNGKSTFLQLINAIVGDKNSTAIDLKSLSSTFRVSNLYGKLVSLAGDISSSQMTDSDLYKALVGGDKIMVERKYEQAFEDRLFTTLFFSCNKLPRTPDTTYAFYRRFCIIPFHANLTKVSKVAGERFKRLLLSEESKEYVAYKAIQAIYNILSVTNDFIEPKVCAEMLNQYRVENSSPLQWAQEQIASKKKILSKGVHDAYAEYRIWCELNGFKPYGINRFQSELSTEFGYKVEINAKGEAVFTV